MMLMRTMLAYLAAHFAFAASMTTSDEVPYPCGDSCGVPGHDPSALQRTAAGFYVALVTGSGGGDAFGLRYLDPDNYTSGFQLGAYSYLTPDWVTDYLYPSGCGDGEKSACPFWAPDLVSSGNGIPPGGDDFIMYYSIAIPNDYGRACIGRAKGRFNSTTQPPSIDWVDAGAPVVCSNKSQVEAGGPHAIDPSVTVDTEGRWWLSYGSWSAKDVGSNGGGVWVVELDATSGFLASSARSQCPGKYGTEYPTPFCWGRENRAFRNVANDPWQDANSIEASYLYNAVDATGFYYLFVNYYFCCRGENSTYEIRVGRATSIRGPFVDREGKLMKNGGGTLVLGTAATPSGEKLAGRAPGHAGIMRISPSKYAFTFDYQGVGSQIQYAPQAKRMHFDDQGWPVVQENWFP